MEYNAPKPTQDYKVLIKCMTYNQEKYIEDALKGFVRQKTNFSFCALVVDDCSTDGNAEIIRRYERMYPDIIKGVYLPVNMYGNPGKKKYIKPWEERAQYIAYCEGDDYWIDENKLQRQVDFLDSHPDYMMHFHNALVRYQNHDRPDRLISNFQSGDFDTALLFEKWQLPLASVLLRKEVLDSQILAELYKVIAGGFCLFIAASRIGKVYGLAECLSVYRKNDGGVSMTMKMPDILQRHYRLGNITKDKRAIRVVDKEAKRVFTPVVKKYLFHDEEAVKIGKVVFTYNPTAFFLCFVSFFLWELKSTIKKHKYIFLAILALIMLAVLINYKAPQWAYSYYENHYTSAEGMTPSDFENNIRNATFSLISSEKWSNISSLARKNTLLNYFFDRPGAAVYDYGEFGYLLHYSYLYGESRHDKELCSLVQEKFDKSVVGGRIFRNDQIAYGNVALDLYRATSNKRYISFAEMLYERLDSLDKADGLIFYHEDLDEQRVDGIGLICYFLYYYAEVSGCSRSAELADEMISEYVKWGIDENNGIPAKAYGRYTHIKHISPNWGRGISWFLQGVKKMDAGNGIYKDKMEILDSTLLAHSSLLFSQYFDEEGIPDMSVTIPILSYLNEKGYKDMKKADFVELISPYCDRDGTVRYCSPMIFAHKEGDKLMSNLYIQGLLLYTLSQLKH